jgi:hypothetical protein
LRRCRAGRGSAHQFHGTTIRLPGARLLLTHRRNLTAKFLDLEKAIQHSLKSLGIRLSKVRRAAFEQAVRQAVADDPLSAEVMDAMLTPCCRRAPRCGDSTAGRTIS